jgi:hypothetical protein
MCGVGEELAHHKPCCLIDDLEDLHNVREPSGLTAADLIGRAEHAVRLCMSGQQSDRKAAVRLYVRGLTADPETRSLTVTLIEPLMIPDTNEGPDPDGSGSSICRYMVGQTVQLHNIVRRPSRCR